jgi:hypothetical protein
MANLLAMTETLDHIATSLRRLLFALGFVCKSLCEELIECVDIPDLLCVSIRVLCLNKFKMIYKIGHLVRINGWIGG